MNVFLEVLYSIVCEKMITNLNFHQEIDKMHDVIM